MDSVVLTSICLAATVLGICSHAIFIRGEWHMRGPDLFQIYSLLAISILCAEYSFTNDISTAIIASCYLIGSYAGGLFSSIIIYRKYFHRLRHFPGPPLAAITKFWHVQKCLGGKNHLLLGKLFEQYGPIIRTGPGELTIIDAAIPDVIGGPKSRCTKAPWYDIFLPDVTVAATRSVTHHDARRRIWDRGFSPKALVVYEERIISHAELLAAQIESVVCDNTSTDSSDEAIINVTEWFAWFAFDVMGEFAFSRSFQMLQDRKWHSKIRLMVDGFAMLVPASPVPWLAIFAKSIKPRLPLARDWFLLLQWCAECMDQRLEMKGQRPDVSHWLIEAYMKNGSQQADRAWLSGDATALIVAGSETVSSALAFAFYELVRDPSQQDKLFKEIQNINIYDRVELQACTHLTAVINETLRLYPPVPTGGNRLTPPSGVTFNNIYIPGGVTIVAPKYVIQRLESSYESADQFIPERWTTRPSMVKDNRGFTPFSQGKYSCIGKSLAMSELRFVIALLLKKFEVQFQDNDRGETLFADLKDQFTFAPGDLPLKFRVRK
ncbi:cytochrome P450 [Nemania diffusa]|nr:cytochrome P450 [Nemania diffusa]